MTDLPRNLPVGYGTGRCSCDEKPDGRCCKLGHPGVVPIEMMLPKATVRPSRYTVTCIPADAAPDAHVWAITVEEQRDGSWIAAHHGSWLTAEGDWEIGYSGSYAVCNHDFDTALRLAKEAAPKVIVNGRTVERALALAANWKRNES